MSSEAAAPAKGLELEAALRLERERRIALERQIEAQHERHRLAGSLGGRPRKIPRNVAKELDDLIRGTGVTRADGIARLSVKYGTTRRAVRKRLEQMEPR